MGNYVIGELQAMRTAMEAFIPAARDYHYSRAEGLGKLISDSSTSETSKSESTETKDGKAENVSKTSKTSTTKEVKPPGTRTTPCTCWGSTSSSTSRQRAP